MIAQAARGNAGYARSVRAAVLFLLLAQTGCYQSHRLGAGGEGVACGEAVCPIGTACVHCPPDTPSGGGPRCRVMRDGAPDFWTWAYECDPSFAPSREVDAFLCDGPEDCDAPDLCLRAYPGSRCDVPCFDCAPPARLCHTSTDCRTGEACVPDDAYRICR